MPLTFRRQSTKRPYGMMITAMWFKVTLQTLFAKKRMPLLSSNVWMFSLLPATACSCKHLSNCVLKNNPLVGHESTLRRSHCCLTRQSCKKLLGTAGPLQSRSLVPRFSRCQPQSFWLEFHNITVVVKEGDEAVLAEVQLQREEDTQSHDVSQL